MKYALLIAGLVLVGGGCLSGVKPSTDTETTVSEEAEVRVQTFKLKGISFEVPEPWYVVTSAGSTARIRTDEEPYQVDLVMEIEEDGFTPVTGQIPVAKAVSGDIYVEGCGGPFACHGLVLGDASFSVIWTIDSDQPVPENLDGVWSPDHDFDQDDLLDILVSATIETE